MFQPRFRSAGAAALTLSAGLLVPVSAYGQEPKPQVEKVLVAVPQSLTQDADETRREFYRILDAYPPGLGRVMRLDPTLMTNAAYLASYPNVAAFLSQHPDVPRNPGFYLERYDPNFRLNEPTDARREALRMWNDAISFVGAFLVFCVITFAVFGVVKYLIEYRRWNRISKVNSEVHNKILDRFASNEELLAYIDSPAGRRFLEATPIAPLGVPTRVNVPFGRMLLSVQIGILLIALAIGLMLVAGNAIDEVQQLLRGLSIVALCLGVGCVVSAAASYILSRRLGLLQEAPTAPPPAST